MTKLVPTAKKRAMDRRGSVPMFVCALVPAIAFMGIFTVRAANTWVTQARLQSALDAGALAAARDINRLQHGTAAEKQAALDRIKALVAGIYNDSSGNSTSLSASNVSVNVAGDKVNLSGSVNAPDPATGGTRTITKTSGATRSNSGLELALIFDITLSMTATDAGGGKTRIDAARGAAGNLLEILYDDLPKNKDGTPNANNKKWLENLFISVVPFATAVNYGIANKGFLGSARPIEVDQVSWSNAMTEWGGCLEMRDISFSDAAPTGNARLNRFFAPSSYDATKKYVANLPTSDKNFACRLEAAYQDTWYLADTNGRTPASYHNVCMGHNDWTAPQALFTQRQNALLKRMVNWSSHVAAGIDPWAVAHGPNMMCPTEETHRVLPLTRDRATVEARIANMTLKKLPFSAGTNIAPGLQAGWFTLSQHWRKQDDVQGGFAGWKSEEPVTTTDTRPPLPALPLDYHLPNRQKVLILLTDGDNDWFSARDFQTDDSSTKNVNESLQLVRPESVSSRPEGFYGSYGYIRDQLGATTLSAAETAINARTLELCQKIRTRKPKVKATDPEGPEQITIYTIRFGPSEGSTAAVQMMTNCASKNSKGETLYYYAPNETKLREVFTAIGAELSKLRLSQ